MGESSYLTSYSVAEAVIQGCSVKKVFLEILQNSQGKHLCHNLFFNKETLAQMFCCEFCEISKNTFFLQNTSSGCFCSCSWLLFVVWSCVCKYSIPAQFEFFHRMNIYCIVHITVLMIKMSHSILY